MRFGRGGSAGDPRGTTRVGCRDEVESQRMRVLEARRMGNVRHWRHRTRHAGVQTLRTQQLSTLGTRCPRGGKPDRPEPPGSNTISSQRETSVPARHLATGCFVSGRGCRRGECAKRVTHAALTRTRDGRQRYGEATVRYSARHGRGQLSESVTAAIEETRRQWPISVELTPLGAEEAALMTPLTHAPDRDCPGRVRGDPWASVPAGWSRSFARDARGRATDSAAQAASGGSAYRVRRTTRIGHRGVATA